MNGELHVFREPLALASAAAACIAQALTRAVQARGRASIALSGGGTPRATYARLTLPPHLEGVPWGAVQVFFGDERCVPAEDPASNARAARETLLDHVRVAPEHVHAIDGTRVPEAAARAYAQELNEVLGDPPVVDLVLLGLGADGHTASLFRSQDLAAGEAVVATRAPVEPRARVSLGLATLARARAGLFLVQGADKAPALERASRGAGPAGEVARALTAAGARLDWYVDSAAHGALRA